MLLHIVPDQKEQHQSRAQLVGQLLGLLRGAIQNCHLQTLQPIVVILKKMELRNMKFWSWNWLWFFGYLLIWLELLVVLISGIDYLWLALGSAGAVLRESGGSQQNSKLTSRNKHMTCCFLECSELVVWKKSGFSASFNDQTCFPNRETFQVCCSPPWLNCFHHPWRRLPSLPLCRWGGGGNKCSNFQNWYLGFRARQTKTRKSKFQRDLWRSHADGEAWHWKDMHCLKHQTVGTCAT